MPHDAKGRLIEVGDTVLMPFRVKMVHAGEDFCNCDLQSIYPMPGDGSRTSLSAVNTRQVLRARFGDDNEPRHTAETNGGITTTFDGVSAPTGG